MNRRCLKHGHRYDFFVPHLVPHPMLPGSYVWEFVCKRRHCGAVLQREDAQLINPPPGSVFRVPTS